MKSIDPRSGIRATVRIPASKSVTHRAIIAAGLARGTSLLREYLQCEDTLHTIDALREMGVEMEDLGGCLEVRGTGGRPIGDGERKVLNLGNSGTSMRLLLSVAALFRGDFLFTGVDRMRSRPVGPLVSALSALGVDASCLEGTGCPPVLVRGGGIQGGRASIDGSKSSQFVSSLLLSAPYAREDTEIRVIGRPVSRPYVDITCGVMERFGVHVERDGYAGFRISAGRGYSGTDFTVQGDVSSASYFWAAAAVTGGTVVTENIDPFAAGQGDIGFLDLLEKMGCNVEKRPGRTTVRGRGLSGIDADMGDMPDMVPTLAAVALFAEGTTVIRNVPHLRHKESDRLRAVTLEWKRLGAQVRELSHGLVIKGGGHLSGAVVDPHDDHRLAMSLAVVGLGVPGIAVKDEACVNKSFPGFWDLWDRLDGVTWRRTGAVPAG